MAAFACYPQAIINNGALIVSQPGSYWMVKNGNFTLTSQSATNTTSMANLKVSSGASLTLDASSFLTVAGDWQTDGDFSGQTGSTVIFNGSSLQTIGGTGAINFGDLKLSNSAGLSLNNSIGIDGLLDLQSGILTTGSGNTVTLGLSGSTANAGASAYVDGKLARTFNTATTKFFPVGKGGNYRPVTFRYSAITGTSIVTAEQTESGLTGTLPGDILPLTTGRRWTIGQSGGSALQFFVTLDATDYASSLPVETLTQNAGIINANPATPDPDYPDYTNSDALDTFGDFGLGMLCKNPVTGGTIAADQSGCGGFTAAALTSSATPSGYSGTLEYQWQKSILSGTSGFQDIIETGSQTYSPGPLTVTTWFRRLARVTCKSGWTGAAVSNAVKMTVYDNFTAGSIQTTGESICYNGNPAIIGNATVASGGDGAITYQWQSSTNAGFSSPTVISNNAATYDPPSGLTATTWYRRQAKDATCNTGWTASTGTWQVMVLTQLTPGSVSSNQNVCTNAVPALITAAGPNGGSITYTGQWQSSSDNVNFADIPGATGTGYQSGALTQTRYFRQMQSAAIGCSSVSTTSVTVTVSPNQITASASVNPVCPGYPTTIYATGGYNYTWDHGLGAGSSKVINPLSADTYTVTGTGINGCAGATASVTISLNPIPNVVIAGSAPGATSGSSYITAGTSEYLNVSGASSYLWSTGSPASQIQVAPTVTTVYTVTGTTGGCSASASHTVNVTLVSAGPNQYVCFGNSATLTANSTGIPSPVYIWTPGNLTGATITVTPVATTTYTVTVNGTYAATVTVFVRLKPVVDAGPNIPIGTGTTGTLSGSMAIPTVAPYAYLWSTSGGSIVSGGNTAGPTVAAAGTYNVAVTDGNGCTSVPDNAIVTVSASGTTVTGNIAYAFNTVNSQMHNVTVVLKQGTETKYTTTTPSTGNGTYQFLNVVSGDYTVCLSSAKPWGGVTSADIVLIQNHYKPVGAVPLIGIKRLAADVVLNGPPAIVDASDRDLINNRRLTPSGYSFLTGDWVFIRAGDISLNPYPAGVIKYANSAGYSDIILSVSGNTVTQDFRALCYGDVDASNTGTKDEENPASGVITSIGLDLTNFPNPFSERTTIRYTVPIKGSVTLEIHTLLGALVRTLTDPDDYEGVHTLFFDRNGLAPGLYLYTVKLTTGDDKIVQTGKMTIVR